MTEPEEDAYLEGQRQIWVQLLKLCCRELGYDDVAKAHGSWIAEREAARAVLRRALSERGVPLPDNLHMADAIERLLKV